MIESLNTARPTREAVIFDWAYTLFEPAGDGAEWIGMAADSLGRRIADDERVALAASLATASIDHERRDSRSDRDMSEREHRGFFGRVCSDAGKIDEKLEGALYAQLQSFWRPYPDVGPVLRQLRSAGVRVGVLSNVGYDIRPLFDRDGLADLVDAVVMSYKHGLVKPDPELFKIVVEILGVAPEGALMVGDTPQTDGGAVRAGLDCYLLPRVPPGSVRGLGRAVEHLRASSFDASVR